MKTNPIYKDQNKVEHNKDWRDAIIEALPEDYKERVEKKANTLTIKPAINSCAKLNVLCAYVSQFDHGGFWYTENGGLRFVTEGGSSDKEATYEDAKAFCEMRK